MVQRDYILRLIEQLGTMLAELRRRVLGGRAEGPEIREEMNQALQRVGLDLDLALSASSETLAMLVAPTGEVDPTRCWVLAECLYIHGLEREAAGEPGEAAASYERARHLFKVLEPGSAFYGLEEANERRADIEERLTRLR